MYIGSAQDVPMPTTQPGYTDITINSVIVEYRLNGGPWRPAIATDGAFDSSHEDFKFVPLLCQNATYLIEARAINSVGHVSSTASDTLTVSSTIPCRSVFLPTIMVNYGSGALQSGTRPGTEPIPSSRHFRHLTCLTHDRWRVRSEPRAGRKSVSDYLYTHCLERLHC